MKRNSFFLALFVTVLAFGLVDAQVTENAFILDNTQGEMSPGVIGRNLTDSVVFNLRINIMENVVLLQGHTNGFHVYSPDGATWEPGMYGVQSDAWKANFNVTSVNQYSADGIGADTLGFNGVSFGGGVVPPAGGYSSVQWKIVVNLDKNNAANDGLTLCLDSTATYPPSNNWKWGGSAVNYPPSGDIFPTFSGPHCWTLEFVANQPPEIVDPGLGTDYAALHCAPFEIDFDATDFEGDPFTFELVSGPGAINPNTGVWTWNPGLADVGMYVIEVAANDGQQGPVFPLNIIVQNQAPVITNCPAVVLNAQVGVDRITDLNATDGCSDVITWSIIGGTGAADATIDPNTGVVIFNASAGGNWTVLVEATDGDMATTCEIEYLAVTGAPYAVVIEKDEGQTGFGALQGQFTWVDVTLDAAEGPIGGFSFLIAYDASALSFASASVENSPFYQDCDWEYFTYRTGANGNCGGGCPTGLVNVVGIAETNNGPAHPTFDCITGILFQLQFLVSSDRNLECMFVPIRFFWVDCTDNTMSNIGGDTLLVSQAVFDYQGFGSDTYSLNIGNPNYGFPTWLGFQYSCLTNPDPNKPTPREAIGFYNGGVDIVCANDIDDRGDINLNGIAYEIADVVMFTNYFVYGNAAFTVIQGAAFPIEAATAASDVNADGLTLTVADLVYMIRVVIGDAFPYPKTVPVDVSYTNANGVLSVNAPVAAAWVISEGAEPVLLADNMEIKTAQVDGVWRTIIFSTEQGATFEGAFLNTNGRVTYIEMATYDGVPVRNLEMPTDYSVAQNYPNPFNPTTTIEFALPTNSDVSIKIYNVTGQLVKEISGTYQTGTHSVEVDMTNQSSGVYFYKVSANDFSKTMKMVLLK